MMNLGSVNVYYAILYPIIVVVATKRFQLCLPVVITQASYESFIENVQ